MCIHSTLPNTLYTMTGLLDGTRTIRSGPENSTRLPSALKTLFLWSRRDRLGCIGMSFESIRAFLEFTGKASCSCGSHIVVRTSVTLNSRDSYHHARIVNHHILHSVRFFSFSARLSIIQTQLIYLIPHLKRWVLLRFVRCCSVSASGQRQ